LTWVIVVAFAAAVVIVAAFVEYRFGIVAAFAEYCFEIVVVGLVFVVGVVAAVVEYWLAIIEFDCSPALIPTEDILLLGELVARCCWWWYWVLNSK